MSACAWVEREIEPGTETNKDPALRLYAYIPAEEARARAWLKQLLGQQISLERVRRNDLTVWKLAPSHLVPLAGALAGEFGGAEMRLHVRSSTRRCHPRCVAAKKTPVWECVCRCGGEHHGGRGIRSDWYAEGRTTIAEFGKTQIDQIFLPPGRIPVHKNIWRLIPAPAPEPAPTVELPPQQPSTPTSAPATPAPAMSPPRPVTPTAQHSGDPHRRPAHPAPLPPAPSARPAPAVALAPATQPRKAVAGPLIAAVLVLLAIVIGVWLLDRHTPHHPAPRPTPTIAATSVPPPPPQPPLVPQRGQQAGVAPAPQLPGCYPFESGC